MTQTNHPVKTRAADKKAVVLIGNLTSCLFMARQWHAAGYCVIMLGTRGTAYSAKLSILTSRAIGRFYECVTGPQLIAAAEEITREYGRCRAYLCWDKYINLVLDEAEQLFELFDMPEPGERVLRLLRDKREIEPLLDRLGIPYPGRFTAREVTDGAFAGYPVVVKPAGKRIENEKVTKLLFLNGAESLARYPGGAEQLISDDEAGRILIQKTVSGGNENEFGYGGYFVNGEPFIDVVYRQARQNPRGNCCCAFEEPDASMAARVRDTVMPLVRELRYSGFLECDIKRDAADGGLYLLDVNPRQWGSVNMLCVKLEKGVLFPIERARPVKDALAFYRFPLFEMTCPRAPSQGNASYRAIRAMMKGHAYRTAWALFSARDPMPFLAAYGRGSVNLIRNKLPLGRGRKNV